MKYYVEFSDGSRKEFERAIFAITHAQIHGGRFVFE